MPQRAAADHSGRSPEATVWPGEAYRRPVSPGAKTFAPIRSCLSSSHQAMPCRNPQQHRRQSEVRSPTPRLAPNSPVRWTDQDRLVRPNVEPDVGLAPTRKAPRHNADLAPLAKLQITILRREQDWQPMVRNRKLPHISGVPSRGLGYLCGAGNQRRKAPFEVAYLPECLVSLASGRKSLRGFPQARQQSRQLVQFISFGYSNYALAHAVASSG
jgi:hypothetical protein